MCGRYSVLTEKEIIEVRKILKEWLTLKVNRDSFEFYEKPPWDEVVPTGAAPVVIQDGDGASFENLRFGFRETWASSGVIFNARADALSDEKKMFSQHTNTGRCVVPAAEYYEWKYPRTEDGKKKRKEGVKHRIKDRDGNLLFFAGLYRNTPDGKEFVVITKRPTGEVAAIHDRMPVILRVDQLEDWLTGQIPVKDLQNMAFDAAVEACEVPEKPADGGKDEVEGQMRLF